MSLDRTITPSSQQPEPPSNSSKSDASEQRVSRFNSDATAVASTRRTASTVSDQITFLDPLHDRHDLAIGPSHERRRASTNDIGRVGIRIQRLPRLPFIEGESKIG